jgi:hypothetical protein
LKEKMKKLIGTTFVTVFFPLRGSGLKGVPPLPRRHWLWVSVPLRGSGLKVQREGEPYPAL